MKRIAIVTAGVVASVSAYALTESEASLPSAQEYFRFAATAQICNGGVPAHSSDLQVMREQALAYYRAKAARDGEDFDTATATRALQAGVVPKSLIDSIAAQSTGTNRATMCAINVPAMRQAVARNDLAMSMIGWPGAKPIEEARVAAAAVNVTSATKATLTYVLIPPAPSKSGTAGRPPKLHDLQDCKPDYPMAAIRASAQGRTTLAIEVGDTGKVTDISVKESAGPTPAHQLLDQAAAQAYRNCHFEPALDPSGRPIAGRAVLTYRWALD